MRVINITGNVKNPHIGKAYFFITDIVFGFSLCVNINEVR